MSKDKLPYEPKPLSFSVGGIQYSGMVDIRQKIESGSGNSESIRLVLNDPTHGELLLHMKPPSSLCYNPALVSDSTSLEAETHQFLNLRKPSEQALTDSQLRDQQTAVEKVVAVRSMLTHFCDEEIAKTGHMLPENRGSLPNKLHYIVSIIEPGISTVDEQTNSKKMPVDKPEGEPAIDHRVAMSVFVDSQKHEHAIENASIDGKPIKGAGQLAVMNLMLAEPDCHQGNVLLVDSGDHYSFRPLDFKAMMGARTETSSPDGMGFSVVFFNQDQEDKNKRYLHNIDVFEAELHSPVISQLITQLESNPQDMDKAVQELKEFVDLHKQQPEEAEQFLQESTYLSRIQGLESIVESDMLMHRFGSEEKRNGKELLEFIKDYRQDFVQPEIDYNLAEVASARSNFLQQRKSNPLEAELVSAENFNGFVSKLFPTEATLRDPEQALNGGYRFPFPEDFHQASHVRTEVLETLYRIDTMTKEDMGRWVSPITAEPARQAILGQLEDNQRVVQETVSRFPEYAQYKGKRVEQDRAKVQEREAARAQRVEQGSSVQHEVGVTSTSSSSSSLVQDENLAKQVLDVARKAKLGLGSRGGRHQRSKSDLHLPFEGKENQHPGDSHSQEAGTLASLKKSSFVDKEKSRREGKDIEGQRRP